MKTSITARHFELSDKVRDHATDAMNELEKYFERIVDTRAILTREKDLWNAELIVSVPGEILTAEGKDVRLFSAIDEAAARAERRLKKYKAKLSQNRDRH